jgi:hypothetical protein
MLTWSQKESGLFNKKTSTVNRKKLWKQNLYNIWLSILDCYDIAADPDPYKLPFEENECKAGLCNKNVPT